MGPHYLDRLFAPNAVAVFGASEKADAVGARVFRNVVEGGFAGSIYPINPKHAQVGGYTCYPNIAATPTPVDLAVIATPAPTVPGIIRECGDQGVRAAIVHSAGFAETPAGAQRQKAMLEEARRYNLRILGPSCLGFIRPPVRLNATFSRNNAAPGSLALVSQSGGLCTAILDWAQARGIGFSVMVSLGAVADIDFGDMLDYLALDPHTESILVYVEGISDARRFMSGLRIAARMKPVVVVKAGRHAEGSRAAMSHTGALVGADDVFDAALARAGAVRAMTIEQLFAAAQLLATRRRVHGTRLAIIANGGGPGVMATDRAIDLGLAVPELDPETVARLDLELPEQWSHGNPVDILGDATPGRYRAAVDACLADKAVDGLLVMLTPQAMTQPLDAAQAVVEACAGTGADKPVLACWMGEAQVAQARAALAQGKIPGFPTPESSVEAFAYLAEYRRNQELLLQTPGPLAEQSEPDITGAQLIIDGALSERRSVLTGLESKALLTAFGLPVIPAILARSANEALVAAESIGFPVAMKIESPDIVHRSDVNGVRLNIPNAQAVRGAYRELLAALQERRPDGRVTGVTVERMHVRPHGRELLVGVVRDPVFGPVIAFGAGGTAVEALRDRAVALPPINSFIARRLIGRTRVAPLLGAFRQLLPVKMDALLDALRRVSEIVCELPQIRELEINPLIADPQGVVAVDARVAVDPLTPKLGRYGHMAIHPYPAHLVTPWQLADGTDIVIRPIRPEDAGIEQAFVRNLSPQSRYYRFMQALRELTPEMLVRFTQIDYDRELALIAVTTVSGKEIELAVGRYITNPDGESCEFALVVADDWQGRGVGTRLMQQLIEAARARGFRSMDGEVLASNARMLEFCANLGFEIRSHPNDQNINLVVKSL
jgi:acetyltransferase